MIMVPPPPVVSTPPRTEIVAFAPGVAACADGAIATDGVVRPTPVVVTRYGAAADPAPPEIFRFTFTLGKDGRASAIRRQGDSIITAPYVDTSDLAPALAASRFAAGSVDTRCTIEFVATGTPIDAVPLPLLYELASLPDSAAGIAALAGDRLRPAGSTCARGPGRYRRLNLPPFEQLRSPAADTAWSFVAFDVDSRGRPGKLRVLATSGNRALDRAGVAALAANRYAPGPGYRGCTTHFYSRTPPGRTMPVLPADTPADNGDQPGCVVDPKSIGWLLDGRAYPPAFARRRIEGVAVIGYDTAPWGEIGNVRVILSEPDETFGETARNALRNGRVAPGETGRRNCVRRVRFALAPGPEAEATPP